MRTQNERRLKELEEIYMSKKENSQVGRIIRERMGYQKSQASDSPRDFERDKEEVLDHDQEDRRPKKKSVKIADGKENLDDNEEHGRNPRHSGAGSLKSGAPTSILVNNSKSPIPRGRSVNRS